MQVKVEAAGPCRKRVHVETTAEEIAGDYATVVDEFRKHGRVPGFRKGKAPGAMVERHFARQIVDDLKDRLVPRFYRQAIEEQALNALAVVDVTEIDLSRETGLAFDALVDVPPDFKLPKYKKLTLTRPSEAVTDEEVQEAIDGVCRRFGRYEEATDGEVQDDDLVQVDYDGESDGRRIKDIEGAGPELDEGRDFWLPVGSMSLNFLPGLGEGIKGARVGETRTVDVAFPADYNVEALRGVTAAYTVTVKGRRTQKPQELNEEFVKRMGAESVDAFRAQMREGMERRKHDMAEQAVRDDAARQLLHKADFDLPQTVVQEELSLAVRSMLDRFAQQGATREQIASNQERILEAATQGSTDRVRLGYILARIAEEESVEVTEEDVEARVRSLAERYQVTAEQVRAELEKRHALERLRNDVRSDKAMDAVVAQAKIKEG
jgi:trigger factor